MMGLGKRVLRQGRLIDTRLVYKPFEVDHNRSKADDWNGEVLVKG